MKRIIWSLCCLAWMSLNLQAGELYRWVDKSGRVYYGDMPPADATDVEVRKFPEGILSSEYLPYETRKAQQDFPVVLYVASGCGELCIQARNLLSKRGIPFDEKMVRTKDEIDALKRLTGSEIVPTITIGKTILQGFQSEQWQGELDVAGYPKSAPYRAPGKPATPDASSLAVPANPAQQ